MTQAKCANLQFIRVAPEAAAGVAALAHEIWREYYVPLIGEAQVEYMLINFQSPEAIAKQIRDGYHYYLIKNHAGNTFGYFSVQPRDGVLFLNRLYVRAAKRKKGCGRQAMDFIEQYAGKQGCSRIYLTVNKNNTTAIKAYKKFGFQNTGPVVQDIGDGFVMDDYQMEKKVIDGTA